MRHRMERVLWCGAMWLLIGGCASSQWVYRATGDASHPASPPASIAATTAVERPTVAVRVTAVGVPGETVAETEALSQGLAQSLADGLQAEGYTATVASEASASGAYALACTVEQAGVEQFRRVDTSLIYRLAGECVFGQGETVLWKDAVSQQYDEEMFFNTMTRLPAKYQTRWVQECLLPWRRWVVWRTVHAIQRRAPSAQAAEGQQPETGAIAAPATSPEAGTPPSPTK